MKKKKGIVREYPSKYPIDQYEGMKSLANGSQGWLEVTGGVLKNTWNGIKGFF